MFSTGFENEKLRLPVLWPLAVMLAIVAGRAAAQEPVSPPQQLAPCQPATGTGVTVEAVDIHLDIRLTDGRKLRLRGIDPPRGTSANPQLAEEARAYLEKNITGKTLSAHVAPGERDRWGRYHADLFLEDGVPAASRLIAAGWARVEPASAEPGCLAELLQLEGKSRQAGGGLWGDPAYAVISAGNLAAATLASGQIVIVEGLVANAAKWRTLTFLNLGADRRASPSLVLSRRVAAALEKSGRAPESLKGARVRARGLLQLRNGPRIELFSASALEVLAVKPGP